ncbi:MAG: uroporphyrinogen-III C-methyltransferase [Dehalococcoidia bacterium]
MNEHTIGRVAIVGAGPGDPGLLTLAAARELAAAEVVFYDALASPAVLRHARPGADLRYVGKRAGSHALSQEEINTLLVSEARAGRRVVRLKGGDPFVFGRGGEEALALRDAGIPFVVVPGVTSAIAAPAYAGIPVTHRGVSTGFLVVTGSESSDEDSDVDWEAAARVPTLVILMGLASLDRNMERLRAAGKPPSTPAALVRWGTRTDQVVLTGTVADIAARARDANLSSPIVTIVGDVVGLAPHLAWFDPGPLAGTSVVVTRARAQASDLADRLEALGARVIEAPTISVCLRDDTPALLQALEGPWDWVVFTSQNAVDAAFAALARIGRDARAFAAARIAAVGAATEAALAGHGLRADFVPSRATGATLASELPGAAGARILFLASSLAGDALATALAARGAHVEQVTAYDNVSEPLDAERLREVTGADAITFTSASTARNLRQALGEQPLAPSTKLVSIGPQTSAAVREAFGRLDREAKEPSIEALVAAVRELLA